MDLVLVKLWYLGQQLELGVLYCGAPTGTWSRVAGGAKPGVAELVGS